MSGRISIDVFESEQAPVEAWERLLSVLAGREQPRVEPDAVKVVNLIATVPCDVRIRPGRFEHWHLARCRHHYYRFELAAGVVFHLMKLFGLPRVAEPSVSLLQRAGLGSPLPEHKEHAVWIVPAPDQLEILVRPAPAQLGPRRGFPVRTQGPLWAVPKPCTRPELTLVPAAFPCPHCNARPASFRELPSQTALVCPTCGRSFDRRGSRV